MTDGLTNTSGSHVQSIRELKSVSVNLKIVIRLQKQARVKFVNIERSAAVSFGKK